MYLSQKTMFGMWVAVGFLAIHAVAVEPIQPIDLGNHRELFIDDYLVGEMKNVQLLVH